MAHLTLRNPKNLYPVMSSLFDDFLSNAFIEEQTEENQWMPMDVSERENEYIIRANMPGISRDNIRVSVHNHELVIEGKWQEEKTKEDETVHRYERFKGDYQRAVNLPEGCNTDRVHAKLENGVLYVSIPKQEPTPTKEVKIS